MTVTSALLSFAVIAGLVTLTPGLDTALVVRATVAGGRRVGLLTGAGVSTGVMGWGLLAAAGATAVLAASPRAFAGLRLAGAGYLVVMGLRLLWSAAVAGRYAAEPGVAELPDRRLTGWTGYRQGLVCNALNPKVGVFYLAMLPQFIPAGVPALPMGAALAAVHVAEGMTWFAVIVLAVGTVRGWLVRARRGVDGVTGLALVGFGAAIGLHR